MTSYLLMRLDGELWRIVSKHMSELRAIKKLQRIAKPGQQYMIAEVRLTYSPKAET